MGQARRIWSRSLVRDPSKEGQDPALTTRVIATKCATTSAKEEEDPSAVPVHQDDPMDQLWRLQEDGSMQSVSTGLCLIEGPLDQRSDDLSLNRADSNADEVAEEDYDAYLGGAVPSLPHGSRSVHLGPCDTEGVTLWTYGAGPGGFLQSQSSGECLEVVVTELNRYLAAGKKLQTGRCQVINPADKYGNDVREHQSWVMPSGSGAGEGSTLLNLYQRSCLTVDRDAPPGALEVWVTALENYDAAVLFLNKDPIARRISVPITAINEGLKGLPESALLSEGAGGGGGGEDEPIYITDLWTGDQVRHLPGSSVVTQLVPSHGVQVLRISKTKA